jgi:hypothetical protein
MASIRELLFPPQPPRDGAVFDGSISNLAPDRFPLEQLTVPTLIISARGTITSPFAGSLPRRRSASRVRSS